MGTLSIHNLDDETERRIRQRARASGKSLNQTMKELLAGSVGSPPTAARGRGDEFEDLCGVWSDADRREFDDALADQERIDPEVWR